VLAMTIEPVAEKLGKLLKLLSLPQEGEVLNAARPILRTLEGAGADIHELAACIEGGKLSKADMQRIYDAAYQDGNCGAMNFITLVRLGTTWLSNAATTMMVDCRHVSAKWHYRTR
jgi:hypothetical protein